MVAGHRGGIRRDPDYRQLSWMLLNELTKLCDLPDGPAKMQQQRHAIYVLRNDLHAVLVGRADNLTHAAMTTHGHEETPAADDDTQAEMA